MAVVKRFYDSYHNRKKGEEKKNENFGKISDQNENKLNEGEKLWII